MNGARFIMSSLHTHYDLIDDVIMSSLQGHNEPIMPPSRRHTQAPSLGVPGAVFHAVLQCTKTRMCCTAHVRTTTNRLRLPCPRQHPRLRQPPCQLHSLRPAVRGRGGIQLESNWVPTCGIHSLESNRNPSVESTHWNPPTMLHMCRSSCL